MLWYIFIPLFLLVAGGIGAMLYITLPIAKRVYKAQLVRTSPDIWGYTCSAPDNEEQMAMWEAGCRWAEENRAAMREVDIENDGFHLHGEYYDFGHKRCVLVLPGRCESLMYSYYFAAPYQAAGCNVLVIDTRCHGRSGGTHASIGKKESRDVHAWARFAEKELGMESVCLHCICIGSASGVLAITSPDCPAVITDIIMEGCFTTFRESFRQHMIADHRPVFPVCDLAMWQIKKHTGTNVLTSSPIANIHKVKNQRVLFLHGEKDIFSRPEQARRLFKKCGSADKKLVWFPKGGHSHLRINNTADYDRAIAEFLNV